MKPSDFRAWALKVLSSRSASVVALEIALRLMYWKGVEDGKKEVKK